MEAITPLNNKLREEFNKELKHKGRGPYAQPKMTRSTTRDYENQSKQEQFESIFGPPPEETVYESFQEGTVTDTDTIATTERPPTPTNSA